jgi:hypothetical protein
VCDEIYSNGGVVLPHKEIKSSILKPEIVMWGTGFGICRLRLKPLGGLQIIAFGNVFRVRVRIRLLKEEVCHRCENGVKVQLCGVDKISFHVTKTL